MDDNVCFNIIPGPRHINGLDRLEMSKKMAINLLLTEGYVSPVAFFANNDIMFIVANIDQLMNDHERKDTLAAMFRNLAVRMSATEFVMISEAWTTSGTKEEIEAAVEVGVGNIPQRIEVLMIIHENHNTSSSTLYPIIRNADNEIIRLDDPEKSINATYIGGRFTGVLPHRGTHD